MNSTKINPLINRMKVDKINELLAFTHKYPTSGQNCIDNLMETDSWLNLSYDTICVLNDVFHCGYTPIDICKLFPNK